VRRGHAGWLATWPGNVSGAAPPGRLRPRNAFAPALADRQHPPQK
jgi:hypothetical protein